MEQIELFATPRKVVGKQVKALRRTGQIPVNLYGRSVKPLALQVETKTLSRVLAHAGTSRLIKLTVQGDQDWHMTLARDIQREPITGSLYHVDLFAVSMTERIKLEVNILITGESPAVQRGEGVLVVAMNNVQIECLPGDLIDAIRVDVSNLDKIDAQITVKELAVSDRIKILADPDDTVVRVTPVKEEKVEEAVPAAEAVAEVEVIEKGKKEEEVPEEK
jgi:large subunit ribosomal protein L25